MTQRFLNSIMKGWLFLFCCRSFILPAQSINEFPPGVKKLAEAYPSFIKGYDKNRIVFTDGSTIVYDDGLSKSHPELLRNADIEDIFTYPYILGTEDMKIKKDHDPGRIRNEEFLLKMYGKTAKEVEKNLTTITWCPSLLGQKIQVTTINNVHEQLEKVSRELDGHPEWKEYLKSSGGYNRRFISGTKRLSSHSFGIAIDLNTTFSNYWQWDCRCKDENADLGYKNRIPLQIVAIFEKYGFIWGGKWYHYDTMHFEYRPEFLISRYSLQF